MRCVPFIYFKLQKHFSLARVSRLSFFILPLSDGDVSTEYRHRYI